MTILYTQLIKNIKYSVTSSVGNGFEYRIEY